MDPRECGDSFFGHHLAVLYRRPWRRLFRKQHLLVCVICEAEVVEP